MTRVTITADVPTHRPAPDTRARGLALEVMRKTAAESGRYVLEHLLQHTGRDEPLQGRYVHHFSAPTHLLQPIDLEEA